jgi:hypothetical protein
MFEWQNDTDLPKITDVFDPSNPSATNFFDMFTYVFVHFLGVWFFAFIIGVLGGALYIKTENTSITLVYFIVMTVLLGGFYPNGVLPVIFVYVIGVIAAFVLGFLLYQLFVGTKED